MTRWVIHGAVIAMCAYAAGSAHAEQWPTEAAMEGLLREQAEVYGLDPDRFIRVARCENTLLDPWVRDRYHVGIAQWARGRGNHWDYSSAWTEQRLDIVALYEAYHPDAPFFDAQAFAQVFAASPGGWPVCRWRY